MRVRTMADLGALVRESREHSGLTQAELARRAGVSREWLLKVEAGRTPAEMPRVLDLLDELGMVLDVHTQEG
ncbi:helix-turn-helix domain-containing protein [Occultella kanbiaonis]|uniref:helix-turn-helix domain-containing protein n=1 Tax=Occultella kanbiaonis TaxID=2675754 RepID=UPI0013D0DC85|nr:helix-turn-helix domain-containing protein [Occultella kanbiaonis]